MNIGKVNINVPLQGKDRITRILNHYKVSWDWKLQPKDILIATELFYQFLLLKKDGVDEGVINDTLFSKRNKTELLKKLEMTEHSFANSLTNLRYVGLIKNNNLVKHYIPSSILNDEFIFQMTFKNKIDGK